MTNKKLSSIVADPLLERLLQDGSSFYITNGTIGGWVDFAQIKDSFRSESQPNYVLQTFDDADLIDGGVEYYLEIPHVLGNTVFVNVINESGEVVKPDGIVTTGTTINTTVVTFTSLRPLTGTWQILILGGLNVPTAPTFNSRVLASGILEFGVFKSADQFVDVTYPFNIASAYVYGLTEKRNIIQVELINPINIPFTLNISLIPVDSSDQDTYKWSRPLQYKIESPTGIRIFANQDNEHCNYRIDINVVERRTV